MTVWQLNYIMVLVHNIPVFRAYIIRSFECIMRLFFDAARTDKNTQQLLLSACVVINVRPLAERPSEVFPCIDFTLCSDFTWALGERTRFSILPWPATSCSYRQIVFCHFLFHLMCNITKKAKPTFAALNGCFTFPTLLIIRPRLLSPGRPL